jgi:hypothetical protein
MLLSHASVTSSCLRSNALFAAANSARQRVRSVGASALVRSRFASSRACLIFPQMPLRQTGQNSHDRPGRPLVSCMAACTAHAGCMNRASPRHAHSLLTTSPSASRHASTACSRALHFSFPSLLSEPLPANLWAVPHGGHGHRMTWKPCDQCLCGVRRGHGVRRACVKREGACTCVCVCACVRVCVCACVCACVCVLWQEGMHHTHACESLGICWPFDRCKAANRYAVPSVCRRAVRVMCWPNTSRRTGLGGHDFETHCLQTCAREGHAQKKEDGQGFTTGTSAHATRRSRRGDAQWAPCSGPIRVTPKCLGASRGLYFVSLRMCLNYILG